MAYRKEHIDVEQAKSVRIDEGLEEDQDIVREE